MNAQELSNVLRASPLPRLRDLLPMMGSPERRAAWREVVEELCDRLKGAKLHEACARYNPYQYKFLLIAIDRI